MFDNGVIPANGWNNERVWRIGPVCIEGKECPEITGETPKIIIIRTAENKIRYLLNLYPNHEWIAFMEGSLAEGVYSITDIEVFEQENGSAHTELTPEGDKQLAEWRKTHNTIGWIHSHSDMAVFQSADDVDTANMYPVSITVNNKMEMFCTVKKKLSCGKEALAEATPMLEIGEPGQSFVDRVKSLVKEKAYDYWKKDNGVWSEGEGVWKTENTSKQHSLFKGAHICKACGNHIKRNKLNFCSKCGAPFHIKCMEGDLCIFCLHQIEESTDETNSLTPPEREEIRMQQLNDRYLM